MLSMLRLLSITALLSSALSASNVDADIEKFLRKSFSKNPNIVKLDVKVQQKVKLTKLKSWDAYVVNMAATVKTRAKNRTIKQNVIWFSNGDVLTPELFDLKTGKSLKDTDVNLFKDEFYKEQNLISGDANSTHKVIIFSDPLCPFCKRNVPKTLKFMMKKPKEYAIYYVHFPLLTIHPASGPLVKAAIAAEHNGAKDVVSKLYKIKVSTHENNVSKILGEFNKVMKTNIKEADIKDEKVLQELKSDEDIATSLMVSGTPSIYVDGKKANITKYR